MRHIRQLNIWDNPPIPSYHQTTNISAKEAIDKEKKCEKQEDRFLEIYKQYVTLSPSQAHKIYCSGYGDIPITSSRRAVSNLKKSGYLIRLDEMVQGLYDTEHLYQYIK